MPFGSLARPPPLPNGVKAAGLAAGAGEGEERRGEACEEAPSFQDLGRGEAALVPGHPVLPAPPYQAEHVVPEGLCAFERMAAVCD